MRRAKLMAHFMSDDVGGIHARWLNARGNAGGLPLKGVATNGAERSQALIRETIQLSIENMANIVIACTYHFVELVFVL